MKTFVSTYAMSKHSAKAPTPIVSKIVARYAHFFDRPEARLRFFNHTLVQQGVREQRLHQILRPLGFIKATIFYQWALRLSLHFLIFEELKKQLPTGSETRRRVFQQIKTSPTTALFFWSYRARHLIYGLCLVAAAGALFGIYSLAIVSASRINVYLARARASAQEGRSAPVSAAPPSAVYAATSVKYLPDYQSEKVWMVEQKDSYERYSNGARILTEFEVDNHARGYYVLPRDASATTPVEEGVRHEPVGILYHASEGDLLPFNSNNNDSIEERSRHLLEYVRKNRSYNYLIDRFGQIYRIVRDDQAANHAGHSVWADERGAYVGLNESFIGVSFETSSDIPSLAEQLTEAQLIAGRLLTAIIRSHYNIADADCVTHGLVSVNPTNMLIAYHRDWARNFPFEAMGLSDKYKIPPVSITEFGFRSDGTVVWPGVKEAEDEFKRRAEGASMTPEGLRQSLRERYREQMELTRKLHLTSSAATDKTGTDADETPTHASRQSESKDTGN